MSLFVRQTSRGMTDDSALAWREIEQAKAERNLKTCILR